MRTSLAGQRIVITGAARGIGLATAKELHSRGAHVVIGDLDPVAAAVAASAIGPDVEAYGLNTADRDSYAAFIANASAGGPIDVLINNAGIMPIGRFIDLDPHVYQRILEINVLGYLHGLHLVLPDMVSRGSGHIVNVASTAGKTPVPGGLAYCASKSAVVAMTETARTEYAADGINFTCVLPHFTNTDLIDGTKGMKFPPRVEPEDVAHGIATAIEKERKDVFVPAIVGPMLKTQPLMGRRFRDFLSRKLGAYDAFLDFDTTKRSGYEQRASNS